MDFLSHTSFTVFCAPRALPKINKFDRLLMQFPLTKHIFAIQNINFSRPPLADEFTLFTSQADATQASIELSYIQLPLSRGGANLEGGANLRNSTDAINRMPYGRCFF